MDSKEKELYTAILIATLIIAAILLYFIFSYYMVSKNNRSLSKAKISAEITTLENERKRIASDLHDDVGPLLSAIKIQINHLDGQNEAEAALIRKSSKYIDDIIKRMREISNDLLPNVLIRKGLAAAIQDFLGKMNDSDSLKNHIHLPARAAGASKCRSKRVPDSTGNSAQYREACRGHPFANTTGD
jgi:Signal transduction histidine kinase